jgi:hypothetical protein
MHAYALSHPLHLGVRGARRQAPPHSRGGGERDAGGQAAGLGHVRRGARARALRPVWRWRGVPPPAAGAAGGGRRGCPPRGRWCSSSSGRRRCWRRRRCRSSRRGTCRGVGGQAHASEGGAWLLAAEVARQSAGGGAAPSPAARLGSSTFKTRTRTLMRAS